MHSSVFLDAGGRVIRPALLWCDGRTTEQCREITERAGGEQFLRHWVSNPALEGFTLPKVLWLRDREPEAFAKLAKVLLAKDYIRYCLSGELATEPSDAAGTLMYDVAHRRWSAEMLAAVGLDREPGPRRRRLGGGARPRECARRDRDRPAWPARRSSAAARTTRAAPSASARSRRAKRWSAGARRARC